MNIQPLVISFYTRNTPYEQEVRGLVQSCEKFGLAYHVEGIESQGSWEKNCGFKPYFILEKLKQFKRPVLWVDADAVFLQQPDFSIFDGCDFSVRIFEFLPARNPSKVLSGTLYINDTPAALDLVERWGNNCQRHLKKGEKVWDQYVLRNLVLREKRAKIHPLPVAYCKIYDLDILFIEQKEVIIEHYQASRRFKDSIC